jgi:type VI secretion system secreted protein Hcp
MGGWIKISDIKGDSQDPGHMGWIAVESVNWSSVTRGTGRSNAGGARSERPATSDIVITKKIDVSSPRLMRASVSGPAFQQVTIDMADASGKTYMSFQLGDVVIANVSQSASRGDEGPIESVTLSFTGAAVTQGTTSPGTAAAFSSATSAIAKAIGNAIAHVARGG